jgi:hypothetical protein
MRPRERLTQKHAKSAHLRTRAKSNWTPPRLWGVLVLKD